MKALLPLPYKYFLCFLICIITVFPLWGQAIFENSITGINPNTANPYTAGQIVDANITASGIGRGAGINGINTNDRYNATAWNVATLAPSPWPAPLLSIPCP